jgi:hypothetical protein
MYHRAERLAEAAEPEVPLGATRRLFDSEPPNGSTYVVVLRASGLDDLRDVHRFMLNPVRHLTAASRLGLVPAGVSRRAKMPDRSARIPVTPRREPYSVCPEDATLATEYLLSLVR